MKPGELLARHRNIFLLILLSATLIISGIHSRERLRAASTTVDIPVTAVGAQPSGPLETYRQQRDQEAASDIRALEALCAQETLDMQTRENAAARLQTIIQNRQAQTALEGALLNSSLSPCVAVIAAESITIVTHKAEITEKDTALVLTLSAAHTDISPENVRIITAK